MNLTPPINPITIRLNEWLTGRVLQAFFTANLPGYGFRITSSYRTPAHNREVGGAKDSAHTYGLAKDFWITQGGRDLPPAQVEQLHREKFAPRWDGFSLFEGDHIHANIPREVTRTTGFIGLLLAGGAIFFIIRSNLKKGVAGGAKK